MSLPDAKRISFEHSWSNHAAQALDPASRALWFSFQSATRLNAFPTKDFIVWRRMSGAIDIVDVVRMRDASVSLTRGLVLTFERRNGSSFLVTETPSKPEGLDVFFWVPGVTEVRWCPTDWGVPSTPRSLRVAFNAKTARSFIDDPAEGAQYIQSQRDFLRFCPEQMNNV